MLNEDIICCHLCERKFTEKDSLKKHLKNDSCNHQYEAWTIQQVEYLVKEYEWEKKDTLVRKLQRNWNTIQGKACKLGLHRSNVHNKIIKIGDYNFNYMINKSGYMLISNPKIGIRSMMAHRYVWELENRKRIPENHHIHHKNGRRRDNRISNLELVKNTDHWVHGAIERVSKTCFDVSMEHGFWDLDKDGRPTRDISEAIMLIVTELSEAYEAYRVGNMDEEHGFTEELADVLIRLLDLSYGMGLHIENSMVKKIEFNRKRPYKHGKNF